MPVKSTCRILKGAREILAEPKCWTQFVVARDEHNGATNSMSENAVSWSLSGACIRANGKKDWGPLEQRQVDDALDVISMIIGPGTAVYIWNDHPHRKHEEVLALLSKAIEEADSQLQRAIEQGLVKER